MFRLAKFQRHLQDGVMPTERGQYLSGRRRVELQGTAGGLRTGEDGVLHFFDVNAFLAQQVENAGQHADAVEVPDDE